VKEDAVELFHDPPEVFRVTLAPERARLLARPVWAAPLSQPGRYLSLLDEKGEEIVMLRELEELGKESRAALELELHRRYLTALVERIYAVDPEHGATYFAVRTNRGDREFVMQQLHDNALWFTPTHLLLIDVDGNRFEVPDTRKLDEKSRTMLRAVV
jgi:hypothetical protein